MLELNGQPLSLARLAAVAHGSEAVRLSADARARMAAARRVVEHIIAEGRTVYGINTGFGKLADVVIPPDELEQLQLNLVRSHACGVGNPLSVPETRAMLLLRANVLAQGFSGARSVVAETLVAMLNAGLHPVIPEFGSVGASGDLAPLAHLALVVIGEGEAVFENKRMPGAEALRRANIAPLTLAAKEGIALLNGTQAIAAIGGLALLRAVRLVELADAAGAMTLEALRGTPAAFDERLHAARPHAGQIAVAAHLRALLADSEIRASHLFGDPRVQDAYSLRCMPQVHGAVRDALDHARNIIEIETGSATDNPLIFVSLKSEVQSPKSEESSKFKVQDSKPETENRKLETGNYEVISGGNFHGAPLALALDYAAIAVTDLASITERRIERLVNPDLSEGLPAFLTSQAGTSSGFMIAQVTAAALLNAMRCAAHPASVDNVPTSASKEDHVSMGTNAALKFRSIVEHAERVTAIELLAAAEGLEYRRPLKAGAGVEAVYKIVREYAPRLTQDRALSYDIERIAAAIRDGEFEGQRVRSKNK